jgi:HAD superfamily hydrolase (TIGR01509 family)
MKKIKCIIFDCDGVLVDSEIIANRIEVEVKNEFGLAITLDEQLQKFVGLGLSHPVVQEELRRLPSNYLQLVDDRVADAYAKELEAIVGVTDVLSQLTIPKCVASSSEPEWLRFKLEHTKLLNHFPDAVFSGRSVKRGKPAPDLFQLAISTLGWNATECLVVEDSVAGVQAGRAAGLTVCGFLGGSHIRDGHAEKLRAAGADVIVSDFREILDLL